jgi:hypothetical protein
MKQMTIGGSRDKSNQIKINRKTKQNKTEESGGLVAPGACGRGK